VRQRVMSFGGADREEGGEKTRRPGRLLAIFKAIVLLALASIAAYGMLNEGIYSENLWLPVADGVLVLLLLTVFVRGYYQDVPLSGWVMVAFLAALVGVKGLSMAWTISHTETINEVVRSSMYLAVFLVGLGALTSGRQVGPLMDISLLMITALAGYGLLEMINPVQYQTASFDGVRIDSTLGYANSTAVVLAMGITLALARTTAVRNALLRGLYAALTLAFILALYFTLSRGGIGSLGVGLILLFVLAERRLQMLANLLLVSVPAAWLLWWAQSLEGFMSAGASDQQRVADGAVFSKYLIVALVAAFVLQAGYAFLISRYELMPVGRSVMGALVLTGVVLAVGGGVALVVGHYGGVGKTYETLVSNPSQTANVGQRLTYLSLSNRLEYWPVAWEEWKEHPFTGSGAGTFQFVWLENRPDTMGVKQVHNLYLEQGTETGVFAFLALIGFVVTLAGYSVRSTWRSQGGERRILLAGLVSTLVVYLVSSSIEWHWYIPGSTLIFFVLAAITAKFALREDWDTAEAGGGRLPDREPHEERDTT
jgi:O-Antigen ligase